ncbi:MAG: hypothetical protein ABJR05_10165 [Balneola sp.]
MKAIMAITFIVFYFLLLRPIRSVGINAIKTSIEFVNVEVSPSSSTGLYLDYEKGNYSKRFNFKSAFGMFFLFSGITLILMGSGWKKLGTLGLIHFSLWCIALLFFFIGGKGVVIILQMMDFFIGYLIPLCTLGYPLYLIIEKKMESSS